MTPRRPAVNVTYCRPASHDRAYFQDPAKILEGRVDPPSFNLRNEVMVAKHVHATVISHLFQMGRPEYGLDETEAKRITETMPQMLHGRITPYLFGPGGQIRNTPFNAEPFADLIQNYREFLFNHVKGAFQHGWPPADADVTSDEAITGHIDRMVDEFLQVMARLRKRLQWTHNKIRRLNHVRDAYGTLDGEDEAHYRRCDKMIKKMKGVLRRQSREAEGVDDINT